MISKVLVLDDDAVGICANALDYLDAAADAFGDLGDGQAEMSPKNHWEFSVGKNAAFASNLPRLGVMAIKIGTIRPQNPDRHGIPPGLSQILIHDADSGRPLAVMDGTLITSMRTAAAAALAVKALARPGSDVLTVFGTGMVAEKCLHAVAGILDIRQAYVVGSRPGRAEEFAQLHMSACGFNLVASGAEHAVRMADVIVTATTSRAPIVADKWIKPGAHISALGADWHGKQELEAATLLRSLFVTDSRSQCLEIGEGNVPYREGRITLSDIDAELGEVITGRATGRATDDQITVFDSSGVAPQDCAAAKRVYDRAVALGIGSWVTI